MTLAASLWAAIQGEAWEDLRTPATAIPLQGQSGDPDADSDGTLLFDATTAEQVSLIFQMPHGWVDGSGVRLHVHWSKSTDAAGGVVWEERHRTIANNAIPGAWSEFAAATTRSQAVASNQAVIIDGWAEIAMTGLKGSDMLHVQIRRNPAATADTYAADVRLFDADLHYRAYGLGSEQEYPT
jgi:hypothetical protein